MGNFEKLVVLVVLLASAGALAVSLNNSETTQGTPSNPEATPAGAAQDDMGSGVKPASQSTAPKAKSPKSTLPKLDAGFQQAKKSATPSMPSKNGMPYILVNKAGLKPSFMTEDYMTFEPSSSDTWMSLAQKFYGSRSRAGAIKMANEGVSAPGDVDLLMVPLYDFSMEQTQRAAFEPAPELAKPVYQPSDDSGAKSGETVKPATVASNPAGGITYEVISGDSLSLISQKVYGKASRWREIFAANRDKMKDENSLKLGMKLYVPKAGEFKAVVTKDATKVH